MFLHSFFSSCGGLRFFRIDSPRISMRCALCTKRSIEDAIGNGGIADLLVPARHWQLGSQESGASLIAILTDLPDFAALGFIQRSHGPVIDDQNIDATESCRRWRKLPSARARSRSRNKVAARR